MSWSKTQVLTVLMIALIFGAASELKSQNSDSSPLLSSFPEYQKLKASSVFNMQWIQIGPVINSARVEAVQGVPDQPGTFYTAFGSGNLWKTVDHGLNWKPIFNDQAALGIGDFVISPSNPNIIYVGTGESLKKPRNFTMPGVGVYRSDDAGKTWRHLGLPDSYHIGEIVVHPENPEIVFVAVMGHFWTPNENRGIYRSVNGGASWEKVLYIDENTGANDVVISPGNPKVIYASMWNNYPDIAGSTSGVYTSKDGGSTWKQCSNGLPKGEGIGRIGLAVSWQDEKKVYALVDNRSSNVKTTAEIYRSVDGGVSWKRTHEDDLEFMARLWYFADCYVNPENDNEIWGLGVRVAHSTDGGKTFDMLGGNVYHHNPSPAMPLHLDHCEMWVNPSNPNHLMLGNDGGLYMSYDKGQNWRHYNNIPAGEFYDISVDNQDPYLIYGGTQDDASVYGPSREWNPLYPDDWKYIWLDAWSGGDGCVTIPDPENSDIIYTSSQNGGIFRKQMSADRSKGIAPRLPRNVKGRLNYNFIAPYIVSSHVTSRLYHAGNFVFRSDNKGDQWDLISPDLAQSVYPERKSLAAGAIAESPKNPNLLFVGTDHGAFWVTSDQGKTWQERSLGLPVAYIRSIEPSHFVENRVYVTLTGINYDDLGRHIYVSEDLGRTWKDIGSNLPDEIMNCVVEDPKHEKVIFAGGYRGTYISLNRGETWDLFGTNLSALCVSDLVIQDRERDLVMGTHGRGIYKISLKSLDYFLDNTPDNKGVLFPIQTGFAPYYNDTHRDVNPESVKKTTFAFWLEKSKPMRLSVYNGINQVYTISVDGKPGINEIRWDLVVKEQDDGSPYFIRFKEYLKAGQYAVKLEGEGVRSEQKWTVEQTTFPYK